MCERDLSLYIIHVTLPTHPPLERPLVQDPPLQHVHRDVGVELRQLRGAGLGPGGPQLLLREVELCVGC